MGNFSSLGGLRQDEEFGHATPRAMELLIFPRVRSSHTASVMAYAVVAQAGQMIDNGLKTAKNLANAGMRLPD